MTKRCTEKITNVTVSAISRPVHNVPVKSDVAIVLRDTFTAWCYQYHIIRPLLWYFLRRKRRRVVVDVVVTLGKFREIKRRSERTETKK